MNQSAQIIPISGGIFSEFTQELVIRNPALLGVVSMGHILYKTNHKHRNAVLITPDIVVDRVTGVLIWHLPKVWII